MKQFFKFTFASCLGVFLALVVLFFVFSFMLGNALASDTKPKKISPNSVLELKLNQPIPERTNNVEYMPTDGFLDDKEVLGIHEIVETIKIAKEDKNIKGIYLNLVAGPGGFSTSSILREALEDFKSDGKFIVAYSKFMTQGGYHIASVADKVVLNPLGFVDFRGFSSTRTFYKGMLDKMDAEMEVYYAGQFKSATEQWRLKKMSPQSKFQVRQYLNELYGYFINDISESRNIDPETLRSNADNFIGLSAEKLLEAKMVDELDYESNVEADLKSNLGLSESSKLKMVSLSDYNKAKGPSADFSVKDKIAVVYAEGTIVGGKGQNGSTGGEKYVDIIQDIKKDQKVKAVVLRVNSPGGDAQASDQIWYELEKIQEDGRPVIVSMGDVAASGGYYIACGADKIYADQHTITGSIGVFRLFPVVEKTLENHLGITHDTVITGALSGGLNPVFSPSERERQIMQAGTEQMYQTFLSRVAEGRKMEIDEVHKIAQGRVWTSSAAKANGLVDEIGGLNAAVRYAAEQANLQKWRVSEYPKPKTPLQELMEEIMNPVESVADYQMRSVLGDRYQTIKELERLLQNNSYQARMLETFDFE
ncbi:MAG: signal peptide peptidase SppA [Bacteroidia bacterium]|nr:signal peptide peptidase SppA [Bacteroidia bacterium]